jgi:hypothetical protein
MSDSELDIKIENIINENRINPKKNMNLLRLQKFLTNAEKAIGKIKLPGGYGTGFFCTIPYLNNELKVLITNNHVLNETFFKEEDAIKLELIDGNIKIDLKKKRKIWTNKEIDYTLVEILKDDNIDGFLMIDELIKKEDYSNNEYKKESIYLQAIMENQELEGNQNYYKYSKE